MSSLVHFFSERPSTGYLTSLFATATGIVNILGLAQLLLGCLSLLVGIAAGLITIYAKYQELKRIKHKDTKWP